MKKQLVAALALIASYAFAGVETITYTLPADYSTAKVVPSDYDGYMAIDYAGLEAIPEPAGAPQLLTTVVRIDAPKDAKLLKVAYEADWCTLGEDIKLVPIQPLMVCDKPQEIPFAEPNADLYASYPESPIATFGIQRMSGKAFVPVRVIPFRYTNGKLEAAKRFVIKVEFELLPPLMSNMSFDPAHEVAARDEGYVKTDPNQPDYILIAPKNYFNLWQWYVTERQKDHPEKVLLAKNFADILADFPVNTDDPSKGYYARNDAERLHAYIRQEAKKGTHYFVLAGSWYDAHGCPKDGYATNVRKELTVTTPEAQYRTNADWGIPGIYTIPRSDMGSFFNAGQKPCPSDLFYACCDLPEGAKYPWDYGSFDKADPEGDKIYCNEPDDRIDLMPDVVVTRIGFICGMTWRPGNESITMRQLVEGYLDKVRRVESPDFAGRNRFAGAGHTFSAEPNLTHGSTLRDEMEFYAGQDNVWDKRRPSYWMDADYVVSLFLKDWFTRYLPATHTEYVSTTTLPPWEPDWDSAVRDLHKQDWEISTVVSHGSQGGSMSQVYINEHAQTMTGLTKVFFAPFPCLMSFPDWTENQNSSGHHKLSHNMSMIENPTGGAAFTIGNTRSGWGGGIINRDCSVGDGLGDKMGGFFVKAYVRDRKNPGDSWLHMIQTYAQNGLGWSTGRWILVIDQALGDPLLETRFLSDYTWKGATSGSDVWDLSSDKWTHNNENDEEVSGRYEHAANTTITATDDLTLNVATNAVGTLRLVVNQPDSATFKLTGGTVRVATNMVVSAGNVIFGVGGGVGHEGLEFKGATRGNIRFEGNEKFYLAKIKNGGTVTFAGSNGILDLRNFYWSFNGYIEPIKTSKVNERTMDIEAIAFDGTGTGNIIRSDDPGVLTRYLPTTIENHQIRLETYNGFDGAKEANKSLTIVNGGVTIANNPNYGLAEAKCFEAIDIPLTLEDSTLNIEHVQTFTLGRNATAEQELTIRGTSAITASYNGRLGLYGTTTFNLVDDAELRISAPLDDRGNAKMVFTGSGTLVIESATSLVGEVEIGNGITVVFKRLSLAGVTSLTIKDNAKVVLPQSSTGSYQITPIVGSQLIVGEGVVFYNGSLDNPMEGCIANANGSVFDPSGVLTWLGDGQGLWSGNTWYASGATKKFTNDSGVLFADKAGDNPVLTRNVSVDGRYVGKFMQFINTEPYTITGTTSDAMLAFGTMTTGGDVTFKNLELNVSGVLDAMNGKIEASYLNAEDVRVYNGATLSADKLGYAFDKIRFIRIYFLDHLNDDTEKVNDHRVRMEELYLNYLGDDGNLHTIHNGDISWKGVSGCWVNGNLNVLFDGVDAHTMACSSEKQYSAELVADNTTGLSDMAAGKVYMQINLNHTIPMLSSFGVHSSKRTLPNRDMTHAYRPTKFRIEASYDGATYYTIMPDFGQRDIGGDNTIFYGGWVGGNSTAFKCNYKSAHPTKVKLFAGGMLLADGSHDVAITAEGGAIVKVVPNVQLVGSETTTWNFAEEPVFVDTDDLTLSETPQAILSGGDIAFESLYHFKPINPKASLRYENGTISVVAGDGMVGPYTRTFNGVENWNANTSGGWHYYGEDAEGNRLYLPFEKPWSEYSLEQNVDVVLDLATDSIVTLDADVLCDTVRAADTNNLCGCTLTIKDDGIHTIKAQTLDFSGFNVGEVIYELNCGEAHVIAGARTVLLGGGKGLLTIGAGNTAVITEPWQGTVEGEGTLILDPGEGKEWTDLGCLNLSAKLTVELASGSLTIPEDAVWGISRLAIDEGATIRTTSTAEGWILKNRNLTLDGTLEIAAGADGWMTNLNYGKISGNGTIAYVNDTGTPVTSLPNLAAASTLSFAVGRGEFRLETASFAKLTVRDGATFSAKSLADTSKIKYIRVYITSATGNNVRLSRFRVLNGSSNIALSGSITCSGATSYSGLSMLTKGEEPQFIEFMLFGGDFPSITATPEKYANREVYLTFALSNAIQMFDHYAIQLGDNGWGSPTSWDIEVSTDGQEFVHVGSAKSTFSGALAKYTGTASRVAPLDVEAGGTLLASGEITAKINLAAGSIIKPTLDGSLTLGAGADFILPEAGKVTIDVTEIEVGSSAEVELIKGHTFTEDDLAKFKVVGPKSYKLILGDGGSLKLTRSQIVPKIIIK